MTAPALRCRSGWSPSSAAELNRYIVQMGKTSLLLVLLLALSQLSHAQQYLGTYITNPEVMPGFDKPYSEKIKQAIETMTWRMVVTENAIALYLAEDEEGVTMSYKVDGDFLLAKDSETEPDVYLPFYLEDENTIHGYGTIFFRTE